MIEVLQTLADAWMLLIVVAGITAWAIYDYKQGGE